MLNKLGDDKYKQNSELYKTEELRDKNIKRL